MSDLLESVACPKTESHTEKEHRSANTLTPNNKPSFDFQDREGPQRATREETSNPFATPGIVVTYTQFDSNIRVLYGFLGF
jgi:hypothetical protein